MNFDRRTIWVFAPRTPGVNGQTWSTVSSFQAQDPLVSLYRIRRSGRRVVQSSKGQFTPISPHRPWDFLLSQGVYIPP